MKTEDRREKLARVCKETGLDEVFAEDFLITSNWNVENAMKAYHSAMKDTFEELPREVKSTTLTTKKPPPKLLTRADRTISLSNRCLAKEVRGESSILDKPGNRQDQLPVMHSSTRSLFLLPDISKYEERLAFFVKAELISLPTLKNLYDAGCLNWWADLDTCRKLYPLATVGDGNCLLHAASLAMWGFHDRLLAMRKSLHELFLHPKAQAVRRRWMYHTWYENRNYGGLTFSPEEWDKEWTGVVKLASERPKTFDQTSPTRRKSRSLSYRRNSNEEQQPKIYEGESLDSLEAIHIYMLANLLCRPIIVVADSMLRDNDGRDVAPIPFGGIYLPFERDPNICCRYPLTLAYDLSHFSALVPAVGDAAVRWETSVNCIPIVNRNKRVMPIHFAQEPGANWTRVIDDSLREEVEPLSFEMKLVYLKRYLELVRVKASAYNPHNRRSGGSPTTSSEIPDPTEILATQINIKDVPKYYNEMIDNYVSAVKQRLDESSQPRTAPSTLHRKPQPQPKPVVERDSIEGVNTVPRIANKNPGQKPPIENVSPNTSKNSEVNSQANQLIHSLNNLQVYHQSDCEDDQDKYYITNKHDDTKSNYSEDTKSLHSEDREFSRNEDKKPPYSEDFIMKIKEQKQEQKPRGTNIPAPKNDTTNYNVTISKRGKPPKSPKTPTKSGGLRNMPFAGLFAVRKDIEQLFDEPNTSRRPPVETKREHCRSKGCQFLGSRQHHGYCSGCFKHVSS